MPKFLSDGFFDGSSTDLTVDGKINISDYIVHTGDTNSYFGFGLNDYIKFVTGGSEKFYISSNNVTSITTHDFLSNLHTSNVTGRTDTDTKIEFPGSDVMTFKTGNSERIKINSSGYVGINETNPEQMLHVAGNFRLENQLYDSTNSQGSFGQILSKVTAGTQWIDQGDVTAGEAEIAKTLQVTVKNVSGGELAKGTVVHVSPSASPPSGNIVEVIAADYDDATKMPAVGILKETIADDAEGEAVMSGALSGIATDGFTAGDELYVGADGALTNAKPQTAGQLIQKIAVCVKSHASNGLIKIFGAGRSNDVPLPLYIDNTNQRVGIGIASPQTTLHMGVQAANPTRTEEFRLESRGASGFGGNSIINLYTGQYGTSGVYFGDNITYSSQPARVEFIDVGNALNYDSTQYHNWKVLGSTKMTLRNSSLGIGTTNPEARLHISSETANEDCVVIIESDTDNNDETSNPRLELRQDAGFVIGRLGFRDNTNSLELINQYAEALYLGTSNSTDLTILSNGDVGIGTDNPGTKLEVAGNIKMTETAAGEDTDKFVVLDSGVLKYRTGAEVLSDIGGAESSDSLQLIDVSEPGNTTAEWSLIKTLPVSTGSTRDTLFIKVVGGAWNDKGRYEAEITLSNRDGFNYFWEVKAGDEYNGGVNGSNRLKVIAYSQTDGTVDVYLYKASYMTGYIYATFQNTGGPEIITSLGSPTTTQPSGTEVFNTHGETYSANISSVNGKVGINAAYPGKMLELRGGANEAAIRLRDTGSNVWDIQNSTDGKLDFIRGGSNTYMRINQFGNVGIGVTSHSFLLDIGDSKNDNDVFRVNGSNADVLFSGNTTAPTGGVGLWNFINTGTNATTRFYVQDANNSNDRLTFRFTGNGGSNEILSGTSSGRVGIGTTNPNAKLDIRDGELHFTSSSVNQNPSGKIRFNEYGAGTNVAGAYMEYNGASNYFSMLTNTESVNYEFLRALRGSHLLLQPSSGNVGIGTASPLTKLHTDFDTLANGDVNELVLQSKANGSTYYSNSAITGITFTNWINGYTAGSLNRAAGIYGYNADTAERFGRFMGLSFYTSSLDAAATEKMRIDHLGNVGIGTTDPAAKLDINDSSNDVSLTNTANYAINTGSAISVRHYRNVNLETPKMQWSIGGSTDLNWKKLATIVINDANYAGFGAEVEITDFQGNYGSSMAQYGDVYKGGLSIFHRGGTGVEPEQGIITINNDIAPYIRIYKIAGSGNSSYQIQVKSPGNYRQIHVKLEQGNGNQVASITPHANDTNGSTSGGTAYTPDAYTSGNQFKTAFPTVTANRGFILDKLSVNLTSPAGKFDVRTDSSFGNCRVIIPETTNQNPVLAFYRPTGSAATSYPWWLEANGSTFQIKTGSAANIGSESVSTKVTINSSGDVGIGTDNPGEKLDVNGAIKSNTRIFVGYDSGVTNSISCSNWFRTSGAVGIFFASYGGGLYMNDSTYVTVYNNKAFEVNNTGTSSIRAAGDIVAYYSDERLKTNLGNITNAVDKVKKLNGFYYKNNELANSFGYTEDHLQVGVSAQEVEAIMPEVVKPAPFDLKNKENGESYSASGENYKTVKYEKLVPLLIEAIKEQQKQIDELKNKLDAFTK